MPHHNTAPTRTTTASTTTTRKLLPILVAQYVLVGHIRRSAHWSIVVLESRSIAHIYELAGNSDSFLPIRRLESEFSRGTNLRGGCLVGHIPCENLEWLERKLRDEVDVVRGRIEWDCENWVINALRMLKMGTEESEDGDDEGAETRGMIDISCASGGQIRDELRLDWERWECGEDTLEERLFPM